MADNVDNTSVDTDVIAADDVSGVKYQRVKIAIGTDGSYVGDVSSEHPLPVRAILNGFERLLDNQAITSTSNGERDLGVWTTLDSAMNLVLKVDADLSIGGVRVIVQSRTDTLDIEDVYSSSLFNDKLLTSPILVPNLDYRIVIEKFGTATGSITLDAALNPATVRGTGTFNRTKRSGNSYGNMYIAGLREGVLRIRAIEDVAGMSVRVADAKTGQYLSPLVPLTLNTWVGIPFKTYGSASAYLEFPAGMPAYDAYIEVV